MNTFDISLFYFINNSLANPLFDSIMPFITELHNIWWLYVIAILVSTYNHKERTTTFVVFVLLIVAVGLTDWINSIYLKEIFTRPRPCHTLSDVHLLVPCGSGYSFPSSHAANNFAIIAFLVGVRGRYIPYISFFCVSVALSRIFVGVHYPSDVLGGGLVGTFFGFMFAFVCKKIVPIVSSNILDARK